MGLKAVDALEISFEDLPMYLRSNHSAYVEVGGATYYLTDVNDHQWRAQDTTRKNDKDHYVDCSELVPTVTEFLEVPFHEGKSLTEVFPEATFYASEKPEEE